MVDLPFRSLDHIQVLNVQNCLFRFFASCSGFSLYDCQEVVDDHLERVEVGVFADVSVLIEAIFGRSALL